ncbi:non-ribosomal peptide synthetase [Microbacterium sp. K2]|uniref:non-ribosomal peptide synthetase n=1 Tax=Microbacterium sp. K2 TaxID=3391827 RepID=UPI003EDB1A22
MMAPLMKMPTAPLRTGTVRSDAVCVEASDGASQTYGEFFGNVEKWRRWIERTLAREQVVAAQLDLSPISMALMVASLTVHSRIAWLPPGEAASREQRMIEQLGDSVYLLDDASAARILDEAEAPRLTEIRLDAFGPERWATTTKFIYFTSGSEGRPKAVQVGIGAIANRLQWMWTEFPFAHTDRVVVQKPLSFVASYWEILGSLLGGVVAVLISSAERGRPDLFFDVVSSAGATHLFTTPVALRGLVEVAEEQGSALPALKLVCSSADRFPTSLGHDLAETAPNARILNLYGATETTANTSAYELSATDLSRASVPLGSPISHTRFVIRDSSGVECDEGVEGSVAVQGLPLADGYLIRGVLSDGDAFSGSGESREFLSGDLGYMQDGKLFLTGRADNAVNVSGFKVHLEEIEAAAMQLSGRTGQCAAVHIEDSGANVLALVVPKDWRGHISRTSLARSLPPHMVPRLIVPVETVPLVRTGKVDRWECAALVKEAMRESRNSGHSMGGSDDGDTLARLWTTSLGQDSTAVGDDYFRDGGDSLRAVGLLAAVRRQFGVRVPLRGFYADPSMTFVLSVIRNSSQKALSL